MDGLEPAPTCSCGKHPILEQGDSLCEDCLQSQEEIRQIPYLCVVCNEFHATGRHLCDDIIHGAALAVGANRTVEMISIVRGFHSFSYDIRTWSEALVAGR